MVDLTEQAGVERWIGIWNRMRGRTVEKGWRGSNRQTEFNTRMKGEAREGRHRDGQREKEREREREVREAGG